MIHTPQILNKLLDNRGNYTTYPKQITRQQMINKPQILNKLLDNRGK